MDAREYLWMPGMPNNTHRCQGIPLDALRIPWASMGIPWHP